MTRQAFPPKPPGSPTGLVDVRTIKALGGLSKSETPFAKIVNASVLPIFPFSEQRRYIWYDIVTK